MKHFIVFRYTIQEDMNRTNIISEFKSIINEYFVEIQFTQLMVGWIVFVSLIKNCILFHIFLHWFLELG